MNRSVPTSCAECRRRKKKCTHHAVLPESFRSCTECHRRKKKCNLEEPCSNCARRYPPTECIYPPRDSKYASKVTSDAGTALAIPFQKDESESKLIQIHATSPLATIENGRVNRSQLVALNENFLSIDSMYDLNSNLHNTQTLYHCVYQLTNGNEALDVALQAICLIQLAIRNKDGRLKVESLKMNGKALKLLHRALRNPATTYATETVVASLCARSYEELSCSTEDATGVRQLTKGTRLLVQQRGPASYATPLDHIIFVRWFREFDICHALAQEVPTFLASQEWCTVPWKYIKKDDNDRLVDIIAALANFRATVTHLECAGYTPEDLGYAEEILLHYHELKNMLAQWLVNFEKTNPGPMFSPVSCGEDKASRELFSYKLTFTSLPIAMMYLKYWPTSILLSGSLIRIESYFTAAEASLYPSEIKHRPRQSLRRVVDGSELTEVAKNVCRGLDFALEQTMRSSGPLNLTYPIMVVYYTSARESAPLRSWCAIKLKEIQSSGFEYISQYDAHNLRRTHDRGLKPISAPVI